MPETAMLPPEVVQPTPPTAPSPEADMSAIAAPIESVEPINQQSQPEETVATPETQKQRQTLEVLQVSSSILLRTGREIHDLSPKEQQKLFQEDPGSKDIYSSYLLNALGPGDYQKSNGPKGINVVSQDQRPITISVHGQERALTHIQGGDDKNFFCWTVTKGNTYQLETIPKVEVLRAQFLATNESLLSSQKLSASERTLLEQYIILAKGQEIVTENIDGIITEAAKEAGIFTTEDILAHVDTSMPIPLSMAQTGTELTPAEKTQREEYARKHEQIDQILAGKVIPNAQDLTMVMGVLGENPEAMQKKLGDMEQELRRLQQRAASNPNDQAAQTDVTNALEEYNKAKSMSKSFTTDQEDSLTLYMRAAEEGTIDRATSRLIIKAFRENNMGDIKATLLKELDIKETDPEQVKKWKEKAKLYAKYGMVFSAMMAWFMLQKLRSGGNQ